MFDGLGSESPRVLFLTKYARNGASSRYRTFQYLPWIERAGIQYIVAPLFDESYLLHRYTVGRRQGRDLLNALRRRAVQLGRLGGFDLVVIEYEIFPYFFAFAEQWMNWRGIPYVVDYDDALFHQYDKHRKSLVRGLLGTKIAKVMRGAKAVIAGNAYIAEYACKAGAKRVEIIPTVVDIERYPLALQDKKSDGPFVIGWIGSPATQKYLHLIATALREVCAAGKAVLRLVGASNVELPGVPVEILPWEEKTEARLIQGFDVGIMPLSDDPWARGKCGLKLIQYMACGRPVVASPVGVNREIVDPGVNGFLCDTQEQWVKSLSRLRGDPELGRCYGRQGRRKVEEQYSLQQLAPRYVSLLEEVAEGEQ